MSPFFTIGSSHLLKASYCKPERQNLSLGVPGANEPPNSQPEQATSASASWPPLFLQPGLVTTQRAPKKASDRLLQSG